MPKRDYTITPIPGYRFWIFDVMREARRKSSIAAAITVDVERVRTQMREHRERTGESLSFTGFIIWCTGRAVAAHPTLNRYRLGRRKLITFDDVDILTPIERSADGRNALARHIVRAADRKSFREINDEIRAVQHGASNPADESLQARLIERVRARPSMVTRTLWRLLRKDPRLRRRLDGTVIVTSAGMMVPGAAIHAVVPSGASLCIAVGPISRQPHVVGDGVEPRETLFFSVVADHDIIDGGPGGRFVADLIELLSAGLPPGWSEK
jgi:pyruvate/2-oxoglutarate dehydrogenase complex dihydrolipoamide acyltransferase (E2) component